MKRFLCIFLSLMILVTFSACGNTADQSEENEQTGSANESTQTSEDISEPLESQAEASTSDNSDESEKILIAHFSWAENVVQDESIDAITSPSVKAPGNVAQLASWISEETGGELFSIQVTDPYPADEDSVLSRANDEKAEGIHPELVGTVENMDSYDTVFLGYPNWWYSCPMAILSFIEENDLSDKQIFLFCSHGTGGLARSVQDITAALPDANIADNVFHVYQYDVPEAKEDLLSWLESVGY